jgi:hypothetical protein
VIIFWILTFFAGASAFAFADIYMQLGIGWSLAYAVFAMLVCRGLLSVVKRALIVRERVAPESDVSVRTVEANRASMHEQGTWVGAVLNNRRSRRVVAQLLGSAYIDDWRLMYVNKEGIDLAAEALTAQGELMGDEISGLLDSVGLRKPTAADPYPPELPAVPEELADIKAIAGSA